ncbi:translation elongation factor EF-1alpha (GTPase) HBS1 isoform X2 [Dermatophagoides farinae]|uniref:translation elongation factor EF-1alpha (GTPase) HBS1 isoform X2 n=1 Tax=Dermatophagoides farinae TaxID=6954 RepID=UPI003F5DC06C
MSRHRNIRTRTFSEEYDDYDYDQYGRSVEEDLCISPGTANMYLYENNMNTFPESLDQPSETDDLTSTKLNSCIQFIRDAIGDSKSEEEILFALKQTKCDPESAIDFLLSNQREKKEKQQKSEIIVTESRNSKLFRAVTTKLPNSTKNNANNPIISNDLNHYKIRKFLKDFMIKSLKIYKNQIAAQRDSPKLIKKQTTVNSESNKKAENVETAKRIVPTKMMLQTPEKSSVPPSPISAKIIRQNIKQKSIEEIGKIYHTKRIDGKKMLLNLVIAGHVDAGKSTIMGHLLALLGNVSKKHMHKNETEAKKLGKASFMYAWVLDETDEERNRGITIDVGHHCFETSKRIVNILDAPGHRDFIPNMIMGTTKADVAMLVIDATNGEFESGFEAGGQTQEHILLLRSFGITQVAIVINKMDNVDFDQTRYKQIVDKIRKFLKQVGFKDQSVEYIPCSGMTGDNLIELSKNPNFNWYNGPTVIDIIDNFTCSPRLVDKPFRMSISDLFKGQTSGIYLSGKIDYGYVEANQKLLILPNNEYCTVKNITIDNENQLEAFAGDVVSLNITQVDGLEISIGNLLCDILSPCTMATKFEARIVTFGTIGMPLINGSSVIIYSVCLNEVVTLTKLCAQLDKNKNEVIKRNPRLLGKNQAAIVEITSQKPICIETFDNSKEYGRFVIRSEHFTMGTGIVTKILKTN